MRIIHGFTRRVVIDTNVLISSILSPEGATGRFMSDVYDGRYEVIVTESILNEYDEVMRRPQFKLDLDDIEYININDGKEVYKPSR